MQMLYVNIPVKDLTASVTFFTKLGFAFNEQITDEGATCMIINDMACVMLLTEPRFKDFTKKEVADTNKTTEAIMALAVQTRGEVELMVNAALASGGTASNDMMDGGAMLTWGFQDIDGHLWEVFWMDPDQNEIAEEATA
jgi:uncharacterized protein